MVISVAVAVFVARVVVAFAVAFTLCETLEVVVVVAVVAVVVAHTQREIVAKTRATASNAHAHRASTCISWIRNS